MASPAPSPQDYRVQQAIVMQRADKDVIRALKTAQTDINAQLKALAGRKLGIGETVRRAQLQLAKREIQRELAKMYVILGDVVQARRLEAASRVLNLNKTLDTLKLVAAGLPDGADIAQAIADAELDTARSGLDRMIARTAGAAYVPLADRVYVSETGLNSRIDRLVNSALARGLSAVEFAREVKDFINPNTPGGVRYASLRLARTEINNAAHAVAIDSVQDKPWVETMTWHLSGSHPRVDICDSLARGGPKGDGRYPKASVPAKPHPQCFCYVTPDLPSDEEFIDNLVAGQYDRYIAKYRNIQPGEVVTSRRFTGSQTKAPEPPVKKAAPKPPTAPPKAPTKTVKKVPATAPAQPPVKKVTKAPVKAAPAPPTPVELAKAHLGQFAGNAPTQQARLELGKIMNQMAELSPRSALKLRDARVLDRAGSDALKKATGEPNAVGGYYPGLAKIELADEVITEAARASADFCVRSGWWSHADPGGSMMQSTMRHEYGHHLEQMMRGLSGTQHADMWNQLMANLGAPNFTPIPKNLFRTEVTSQIDKFIAANKTFFEKAVSRYGSTNSHELLAEIWAEFTGATGTNLRPTVARAARVLQQYAEKGA